MMQTKFVLHLWLLEKNVKLLLLLGIVSGMSIVDLVNDAICLL